MRTLIAAALVLFSSSTAFAGRPPANHQPPAHSSSSHAAPARHERPQQVVYVQPTYARAVPVYTTPAPGPGYVWVDGYWYRGVWVSGYWQQVYTAPPPPVLTVAVGPVRVAIR